MTALAPFQNRRFMQHCWVVDDLDAAVDDWVRRTGVGPFHMFGEVSVENALHRGKRTLQF